MNDYTHAFSSAYKLLCRLKCVDTYIPVVFGGNVPGVPVVAGGDEVGVPVVSIGITEIDENVGGE